jgi:uncharacterized membrane protein YkoI
MKKLIFVLLLFTAAGVQAAPAASGWLDAASGQLMLARASGKSLDQAVAQVRRQTGGRILSAETVKRNGRTVHRIKVLTRDNKVRIVHIDANG